MESGEDLLHYRLHYRGYTASHHSQTVFQSSNGFSSAVPSKMDSAVQILYVKWETNHQQCGVWAVGGLDSLVRRSLLTDWARSSLLWTWEVSLCLAVPEARDVW